MIRLLQGSENTKNAGSGNLVIWIILVLLILGLLAFIINTLRCMYINKKKKAEEDLEDLKALRFGGSLSSRNERIELH